MKTYQEYLQIIKKREQQDEEEEREREREIREQWKKDNPGKETIEYYTISGDAGRMTFDYSVEIMGMMMQDFLEELSNLKKP